VIKMRERAEKEFKRQLDRLFQLISGPVMAAAEAGRTKYLYDMRPWVEERQRVLQQEHQQQMQQRAHAHVRMSKEDQKFNLEMQGYMQDELLLECKLLTEGPNEELLNGLRQKFPDCIISIHEDWVETRQGVKELKKGILIDWSYKN